MQLQEGCTLHELFDVAQVFINKGANEEREQKDLLFKTLNQLTSTPIGRTVMRCLPYAAWKYIFEQDLVTKLPAFVWSLQKLNEDNQTEANINTAFQLVFAKDAHVLSPAAWTRAIAKCINEGALDKDTLNYIIQWSHADDANMYKLFSKNCSQRLDRDSEIDYDMTILLIDTLFENSARIYQFHDQPAHVQQLIRDFHVRKDHQPEAVMQCLEVLEEHGVEITKDWTDLFTDFGCLLNAEKFTNKLRKMDRNGSNDISAEAFRRFDDLTATKIQSVARGNQARKKVTELRINIAEAAAATKIQSVARGHQARKEVTELRKNIAEAAAKKIQSVFRGSKARKEVTELRKKNAKAAAAKKIQSVFRGHNAQKDFAEKKHSVTKIQSATRGHLVRISNARMPVKAMIRQLEEIEHQMPNLVRELIACSETYLGKKKFNAIELLQYKNACNEIFANPDHISSLERERWGSLSLVEKIQETFRTLFEYLDKLVATVTGSRFFNDSKPKSSELGEALEAFKQALNDLHPGLPFGAPSA